MALPSINVLSLFSGVGTLDLGFRRVVPTARTVCYVEVEAYAAAVLAARSEEGTLDSATIWDSVVSFDGRPWRGVVDCIIGGFPCSDISDAGKRAGLIDANGNRTRSGLWFEYARIIDEVQPRFVFIENVAALAHRGLDVVLNSLAQMGFDAEWSVRSAAEAGAPHKRERLFLLAWHPARVEAVADSNGLSDERRGGAGDLPSATREVEGEGDQRQRSRDASDNREQALAYDDNDGREGVGSGRVLDDRSQCRSDLDGSSGPAAEMGHHHHHPGLEGRSLRVGERSDEGFAWPPGPEDTLGWREYLRRYPDCAPSVEAASQQHVRGAVDGLASPLDRAVCLCNRIDRLRATGNGVVPQCAELALRDLLERAPAAVAKFLLPSD